MSCPTRAGQFVPLTRGVQPPGLTVTEGLLRVTGQALPSRVLHTHVQVERSATRAPGQLGLWFPVDPGYSPWLCSLKSPELYIREFWITISRGSICMHKHTCTLTKIIILIPKKQLSL